MFKIATWNLNALRVRLEQVLGWLADEEPDVLAVRVRVGPTMGRGHRRAVGLA